RAYYLRWDPVPTAYVSYTYRNEAVARYKQGKFELATALHQKSRALNLADGDTLSLANDYTNLGTVAAKKEDWVTAGEHYATALRLRRQYPEEAIDLANDYINLADARLATGQTDRARLLADSARQLEATALPERDPQAAYTFLTQARIAQAAGQVSTALSLTQRALIVNHTSFADTARGSQPPLENYLDYERYFEALLLKGELLRKTTPGGSTAAHQPYTHAQQLLENVQNELTNREDQITLAGYVYQLADAAVANAHELYERTGDHRWAEAAFFFTEKSKANVLANAMSGNAARRSAGIPDTLLEKEDRLRAELGDYQRELAVAPDSLRRYELNDRIFRANEAYKELLKTYRRDYPRYFELKHSRAVPTITKLRAALRPGQALQTYFTGTRQLFVLTITAGKFSFSGIPLPRRFSRSVTGLNKGIHRRIDRVYLRQASKLGQLLLPHPLPEAQELILVPDGPLLKIPFEALLTEAVMPAEATDFTTLPYLLRKHQIAYAPSASLWYRGLTDKSRSEEPYSHELLAFAPVFATGKTISDAVQGCANESLLAPLPATEGELQTLDSLFQDAGRNSTVFVGQTATKNNLLRSEVEKVRYLHLATHGYVNEATPDLSGLAFYPASTDSRNDFLSVGEVYDLHLQAELVSLSACETGIG
ncbi:MAG: CHAT domain-containing tetratricopeptide repeat protein, partial [Bacteroidota bacterium]